MWRKYGERARKREHSTNEGKNRVPLYPDNFNGTPPQRLAHGNNRPRSSPEHIHRALRRYSREPFQDILTELTSALPDFERLREWAEEHPDRFFSSLQAVARLAGFHEKVELDATLNLDVSKMSDSQLEALLAQKLQALEVQPDVVDAEIVEADTPQPAAAPQDDPEKAPETP